MSFKFYCFLIFLFSFESFFKRTLRCSTANGHQTENSSSRQFQNMKIECSLAYGNIGDDGKIFDESHFTPKVRNTLNSLTSVQKLEMEDSQFSKSQVFVNCKFRECYGSLRSIFENFNHITTQISLLNHNNFFDFVRKNNLKAFSGEIGIMQSFVVDEYEGHINLLQNTAVYQNLNDIPDQFSLSVPLYRVIEEDLIKKTHVILSCDINW